MGVCSEVFEKAVLGSEGAGCWGVIGCDQGMLHWYCFFLAVVVKGEEQDGSTESD